MMKSLECGFSMPIFGMGTWMMGGDVERNHDNDDCRDIQALEYGLSHGLKHIDTAEMYAAGAAERIVGRAIQGRNRQELFITSKVWTTNLKYDDVLRAVENSLKRLGTDYIDLYLIHKPSDEVPIRETMKAMTYLQEEGMVNNIGVSNFSVERFTEAQALTDCKIVANQLHYNLIFREAEEKGLVDFCQKNDIMLIAWRPIQKGLVAECTCEAMKTVCHKYGKSPVQVALNWLISQKNVVTMSTMRSQSHVNENCGALGWTMEPDEIELLRHSFAVQKSVSDSVPLI